MIRSFCSVFGSSVASIARAATIFYPLSAMADNYRHGLSETQIKLMSIMGAILVMGALSSFWYWLKGRFKRYSTTIELKNGNVLTVPIRDRPILETYFTRIQKHLNETSGMPIAVPLSAETAFPQSLPERERNGVSYLLNLRCAIRAGLHPLCNNPTMRTQAASEVRGEILSQVRAFVGDRPHINALSDTPPIQGEYLFAAANGQVITNHRMLIYDPKPPYTINHIIPLSDIKSYRTARASVF